MVDSIATVNAIDPQLKRADPKTIRDTTKEAVVDSMLNIMSKRLSGENEFGQVIFGAKPRFVLSSGFLLPLPSDVQDSDEVTSPIHILSHGLDLQVGRGVAGFIRVQPYGALYVRVYPTSEEMRNHPSCQPAFTLRKEVEREIRAEIRSRRKAEKEKHGKQWWKDPQWPEIDQKIRREAFARFGITYDARAVTQAEQSNDEGGLSREGESDDSTVVTTGYINLPDEAVTPVAPPQKWLRLALELPAFEFSNADYKTARDKATEAINRVVRDRLEAWVRGPDPNTGGPMWGYRRGARDIVPSTIRNWDEYLAAVRASKLLPAVPKIKLNWDIQVRPDYSNSTVASVHVALENVSKDPSPTTATFKETEEAVFQVQLMVSLPKAMHRPLMLDRVEPSYRYYQYLAYPALGFNGGVVSENGGDHRVLRTTWAPRYVQPRIVPTSLEKDGVLADIDALSKPGCIAGLKPLVSSFHNWLKNIEGLPVETGIDPSKTDLIARERAQFEADKRRWAAEIIAIEKGIAILEESQQFWKKKGVPADRRAIPFEAWLSMNEAMAHVAKEKGYTDWRLFQLAFILANIPALVTRIPEFEQYYTDEVREYANAVTLLYFATGGGKSEAFLGLLVFALFLDRLRGKERGVTAMLRYPLRLLTLQQAQRTAKTLAKAELVRLARNHAGEPFALGFWVGRGNTPNSLSDEGVSDVPEVEEAPAAAEPTLLKRPSYRRANERWNKLTKCPFCASVHGTGLRRFRSMKRALGHYCLNPECDWNRRRVEPSPLPFYIVDEDIYELVPSVLLGTVDKLALLGQSQRTIRRFLGLFGFAPWWDPTTGRTYVPREDELRKGPQALGYRTLFPVYRDGDKRFFDPFPSLLIQDEAHLLDESLGTFSGLFETALDAALDELAPLMPDIVAHEPESGVRRRIKVIAASATVSEPKRQMENLYQRPDTVQFPYPGPELYRSFYAGPKAPDKSDAERLALSDRDIERKSQWARVYLSILTNGRPHTVTMVTVLANFHVALSGLYDKLISGDLAKQEQARSHLIAHLTSGVLRPMFERSLNQATPEELATLLDLHRIALTYVTNKKGGDQIMSAEQTEFAKKHREEGLPGYVLNTDLITGAVDAGHIQEVIDKAEKRPKPGEPLPLLNETLRSIVATSAVSHGVDVEELNSMFFAGMPPDIAEYIQASSRVGRTHVGFCVLVPTPQRARDRYIVEVHDIFHRFLERMIAPAAIDRWAEKALVRVVPSFFQAYVCGVRAIKALSTAEEARKPQMPSYRLVKDIVGELNRNAKGFRGEIAHYIRDAFGLKSPFAPEGTPYYEALVDKELENIGRDLTQERYQGTDLRNFFGTRDIAMRPMTSLRDVDKPGIIIPALRDARGTRSLGEGELELAMRFIRRGSGASVDDAEEGDE